MLFFIKKTHNFVLYSGYEPFALLFKRKKYKYKYNYIAHNAKYDIMYVMYTTVQSETKYNYNV